MDQKIYLNFSNPDARAALLSWWGELDHVRGDRAVIRRCHKPLEVAFTPAFHRLRTRLDEIGTMNADQIDRLTIVAGVLSHVKENRPGGKSLQQSFAAQMAGHSPKGGDDAKAAVSGLRFRRLIRMEDDEQLYQEMIRLVRLLGGAVDIASLAQGIYWWNEQTKKEWAFAYYENAPSED
jgi:CRISPR system Cascade subunit CasB